MQSIFLRSTAAIAVSVFSPIMANAQTDTPSTTDKTLDEIIVTGSPLSATAGESLVGVSVISGEKLANNLSGSLGETLKKTPGLSSTFFGPGASRPLIRGQGGDRIRILDNGIGSIDAASSSPDHAGSVEPAMATRIEIIRGSGLLRYGSSASGGVINVIDGRIPDSVPDKPLTGAVRIGASSVDDGYEAAIGVNYKLGEFSGGSLVGHVAASTRKTQDYSIPGFAESAVLRSAEGEADDAQPQDQNRVENSAVQSSALAAGVSWIGQNALVGLAVRNLDSEYGIPGGHGPGEEEGGEEEGGVTVVLGQTRVDGVVRIEFGGALETLTINGGYGDYEHREIEPDGATGTVFTNEGFELRGELLQAERGNWQAAYGAQIRQRDFAAIGAEAFVPPSKSTQIGVFTFQELNIGDWHLEASMRYERNQHENITANISRSFTGFSASAGADYHLTENIRLGGTIFRTSRAPTSEELFSNGPHLATNQFEIGDINLGLEVASGAEISVRFKQGYSFASFNIFATQYSDYVFGRATGAQQDGLPEFIFTASDAVFKGFELEAGAKLATFKSFDLLVDGSVEYVDANLDADGNAPRISLPRIPPLGIALGAVLQSGDWRFRAEIDYAAKQDDTAPGELVTNGYTLVNLQTSYKINDKFTVRGGINNLFDQEARQHTSFLKDIIPLPGRNFKISFSAEF
ncbi:MAG: TonB-dependent receptor [Robiginitomaculum sp.]|nr:TonB-dependent receptor [Robiginitomaculum sp.]